MKEYCEDILVWITDMHYSTTLNTDQKMNLIMADFSEFKAKSFQIELTLRKN